MAQLGIPSVVATLNLVELLRTTKSSAFQSIPNFATLPTYGGILMNTDGIDWVFDASREGTFPKGDGSGWRLVLKNWVLEAILVCLGVVAVVVAALVRPKDVAPELAFAVTMGVFILIFCIFLVWRIYRRASRCNREREAEDMALRREIAQYYREKREQEN